MDRSQYLPLIVAVVSAVPVGLYYAIRRRRLGITDRSYSDSSEAETRDGIIYSDASTLYDSANDSDGFTGSDETYPQSCDDGRIVNSTSSLEKDQTLSTSSISEDALHSDSNIPVYNSTNESDGNVVREHVSSGEAGEAVEGDGPMRSEHQIVVYTESSDDTSTDGRIDTVKEKEQQSSLHSTRLAGSYLTAYEHRSLIQTAKSEQLSPTLKTAYFAMKNEHKTLIQRTRSAGSRLTTPRPYTTQGKQRTSIHAIDHLSPPPQPDVSRAVKTAENCPEGEQKSSVHATRSSMIGGLIAQRPPLRKVRSAQAYKTKPLIIVNNKESKELPQATSAESPPISMLNSAELLKLPMADSSQLSTTSAITVPEEDEDEYLNRIMDRLNSVKEEEQPLSALDKGGASKKGLSIVVISESSEQTAPPSEFSADSIEDQTASQEPLQSRASKTLVQLAASSGSDIALSDSAGDQKEPLQPCVSKSSVQIAASSGSNIVFSDSAGDQREPLQTCVSKSSVHIAASSGSDIVFSDYSAGDQTELQSCANKPSRLTSDSNIDRSDSAGDHDMTELLQSYAGSTTSSIPTAASNESNIDLSDYVGDKILQPYVSNYSVQTATSNESSIALSDSASAGDQTLKPCVSNSSIQTAPSSTKCQLRLETTSEYSCPRTSIARHADFDSAASQGALHPYVSESSVHTAASSESEMKFKGVSACPSESTAYQYLDSAGDQAVSQQPLQSHASESSVHTAASETRSKSVSACPSESTALDSAAVSQKSLQSHASESSVQTAACSESENQFKGASTSEHWLSENTDLDSYSVVGEQAELELSMQTNESENRLRGASTPSENTDLDSYSAVGDQAASREPLHPHASELFMQTSESRSEIRLMRMSASEYWLCENTAYQEFVSVIQQAASQQSCASDSSVQTAASSESHINRFRSLSLTTCPTWQDTDGYQDACESDSSVLTAPSSESNIDLSDSTRFRTAEFRPSTITSWQELDAVFSNQSPSLDPLALQLYPSDSSLQSAASSESGINRFRTSEFLLPRTRTSWDEVDTVLGEQTSPPQPPQQYTSSSESSEDTAASNESEIISRRIPTSDYWPSTSTAWNELDFSVDEQVEARPSASLVNELYSSGSSRGVMDELEIIDNGTISLVISLLVVISIITVIPSFLPINY